MKIEERYMARALQLARCGIGGASPNPMVGAVIVGDNGKIIGEGYHRRCGEGHAEVNAIASVKDRSQLSRSTIYVTLDPCAHYGKTPPCAKLIIDSGIPRVVIGCQDPFAKVSGRGIAMLRDAGIEVVTGLLEQECVALNRRFMTAHTLRRPFVTLKWAQSSDGYMDIKRTPDGIPAKFSTVLGSTLVHRLRSLHDAITAGSGTIEYDRPRLDTRYWPGGRSPQKIINDRSGRIPESYDAEILHEQDTASFLHRLYERNISSVLVEGGAALLQSFIDNDLWDDMRIETAPVRLGSAGGTKAPVITHGYGMITPHTVEQIGGNSVSHYINLHFFGVKNL